MRYAVKDRPIEPFNTELELPEWQLEPDDEVMYGDPSDYYYIDEQGNLVEPGGASRPGRGEGFPENQPGGHGSVSAAIPAKTASRRRQAMISLNGRPAVRAAAAAAG